MPGQRDRQTDRPVNLIYKIAYNGKCMRVGTFCTLLRSLLVDRNGTNQKAGAFRSTPNRRRLKVT